MTVSVLQKEFILFISNNLRKNLKVKLHCSVEIKENLVNELNLSKTKMERMKVEMKTKVERI